MIEQPGGKILTLSEDAQGVEQAQRIYDFESSEFIVVKVNNVYRESEGSPKHAYVDANAYTLMELLVA